MSLVKVLRLNGAFPHLRGGITSLNDVRASPNFKYLAALDDCSNLTVIPLAQEELFCRNVTISNVSNFQWQNSEVDNNYCSLIVLTVNSDLSTYDVRFAYCDEKWVLQSNIVSNVTRETLFTTFHLNDIVVEDGSEDIQLLQTKSRNISLLINQKLVCIVIMGMDNAILLSTTIPLRCQTNRRLIEIAGDFLFYYRSPNGTIDILRLNGDLCAEINVRKTVLNNLIVNSFDIDSLVRIAVSPAVDCLVVVDNNGSTVCFNLQRILQSVVTSERANTWQRSFSSRQSLAWSDTDNVSLSQRMTFSSSDRQSLNSEKSVISNKLSAQSKVGSSVSCPFWVKSHKRTPNYLSGFCFSKIGDHGDRQKSQNSWSFTVPGLGSVSDVEVNHTTVAFWERRLGDAQYMEDFGCLTVCSMTDGSVVAVFRFTEPTYVILRSCCNLPYLTLTRDSVEAVSVKVPQEDIISKVMFYENAVVAAVLAKLNGWQCIAMPLNVLELALRNHQLDAVVFFLKSQEEVNCDCNSVGVNSGASCKEKAAFDIAALLTATVKENMSELGSKNFAEQLLQLSLVHMNKILQNALNVKCDFARDECTAVKIAQVAMSHLVELRKYLINHPVSNSTEVTTSGTDSELLLEQLQNEAPRLYACWCNWLHMKRREIIYDAISNRCLPLAEVFLVDSTQPGTESQSFFNMCRDLGRDFVVDSLERRDVQNAVTILSNLNLDALKELHNIAFNTVNKGLRRFLVAELRAKGVLTEVELKMITYFDAVEQLYSCQSFERALESLSSSSLWRNEDLKELDSVYSLSIAMEEPDVFQFPLGTFGFKTVDNWESTDYCSLTLSWAKSWSCQIWENIIADGTQHKEDSQLQEHISKEVFWRYHLSRNNLSKLLLYLRDFGTDRPTSQVITANMVEDVLSLASPYVANSVLDKLAKFGIFCVEDETNLQSLFLRLARINSDKSAIDIFSSTSASSIPFLEFQEKMIEFCVTNDLPLVLFENVEHFGSSWNEVPNENGEFKNADAVSWYPMMINFRNWIRNPTDAEFVFKASLANAAYQLDLTRPTVTEILKSSSLVVGMATLLCSSGSLEMALKPPETNSEQEWKVDPALLQEVVSKEPTLFHSLKKFVFENHDTLSDPDITVYGLLRDNIPFDIGLLFGWQPANTFKTPDCFTDLPHFSHSELVHEYGHIEELDYTYYLKQGRPSCAYAKFVAGLSACSRQSGITLDREVTLACNTAHSVALDSFHKREVASACVSFMEMLNRDTRGLRIDLQVADTILAHHSNNFLVAASTSSPSSKCESSRLNHDEISDLLLTAVTGGKSAFTDLLNNLEKALLAKCAAENISVASVAGFLLWSLIALFCRRHRLPLNSTYLKLCAQENDWILFSLYAEVHKAPKTMVLQMLDHFPNDRMTHHLRNALNKLRFHSKKQANDKRRTFVHKKKGARDVRANLYSRIGLSSGTAKNQDGARDVKSDGKVSDDDACSQNESLAGSSEDLTDHSGSSSFTSSDIALVHCGKDLPSDLLSVLLYCNQCLNPWRSLLTCAVYLENPVLPVLAACYQEASLLECLCVWLYVSCHCTASEQLLSSRMDNAANRQWCLEDLKHLVAVAMKLQQILLLVEGFYYFQPESPLYHLFLFLKHCIHDKMYETGSVMLKEYLNSLSNVQVDDSTEGSRHIVGNHDWFEVMAVAIINESILQISYPNECIQFLENINSDPFLKSLGSADAIPDYVQLLEILRLLMDTSIRINLSIFLQSTANQTLVDESNAILNQLLSDKLFDVAYKFVAIMGLSKSNVVIAQLHEELSVQHVFQTEGNLQARLAIWNHCSMAFKHNGVPGSLIVDFFMHYGMKIDHPMEKFFVLRLAWTELVDGIPTTKEDAEREKLEREMWLARIAANISVTDDTIVEWDAFFAKSASPGSVKLKSSKEIFSSAEQNPVLEPFHIQNDDEILALEKIISQELDNGNIDTAYRLSQLFDYKCLSLNIVLTCLKLAEGTMALHHLDAEMRILLEKGTLIRPRKLSSRRISRSSSRGTTGSSCEVLEVQSPQTAHLLTVKGNFLAVPVNTDAKPSDEVFEVMDKLIDHCEYGVQCCSRIIVIYNIAVALGLQYLDIVQNYDDASLLKVLLQSDSDDRFFLAKEYIVSSFVDDAFVASFLCTNIVNALRLYMRQKDDDGDENLKSVSELILKPTDSSATFVQLAKLCKDSSVLGSLLLGLMEVGTKSHVQLSLDVELCVRSHTCFTIACHVEGITRSLQKTKKLCQILTEANEFSLMVRLLTGIGRFSETTYIFDILRENHQFELLFRKGMEKVPDLKMALLDYVRRFHPVDTETFTMISLHFSMYREIACMLLSDAKMQMENLDFRNMREQPALSECLENIMQLLADAAESYSKADCMQQSINCTKQAELVALQLYFLNANVQVLCLTPTQVSSFIAKNAKFYESLIVAEAYCRHQDWGQALYNNFVAKNDLGYLRDFLETVNVTTPLCEEVARRFQMSVDKNSKMEANLKQLLGLLDDIQTKYYLAVDLGFDDVVAELLQSDGGSYLKDIINNRQQW